MESCWWLQCGMGGGEDEEPEEGESMFEMCHGTHGRRTGRPTLIFASVSNSGEIHGFGYELGELRR